MSESISAKTSTRGRQERLLDWTETYVLQDRADGDNIDAGLSAHACSDRALASGPRLALHAREGGHGCRKVRGGREALPPTRRGAPRRCRDAVQPGSCPALGRALPRG